MKPVTKKPWARYVAIFLFLSVVVAITVNSVFNRARAMDTSYVRDEAATGAEADKLILSTSNKFLQGTTRAHEVAESVQEIEPTADVAERARWTGGVYRAIYLASGMPEFSADDGTVVRSGDAGALGQLGSLIAMTYHPPASGAYYVADAMNSIGLASPTYAQGYGYYALAPFLQLWRVFRNLVYMVFAIIIIVISMLILFRQGSGSQASVTAQQALPRIVVALILVTFSYAIAGFMIDLMYWLMYVLGGFIEIEGGTTFSGSMNVTKGMLVGGSFADLASIILAGRTKSTFDGVSSMVATFMGGESPGIFTQLTSWVAGGVVTLIFVIALLYSLFRLLFILLKSYAAVLLYTVFSPFFLMMHAIPGTKSFTSWLKKIIANLSPFVVTFVMVVMIGLMNYYTQDSAGGTGFVPPYLVGDGGLGTNGIGMVLSLAMLLALPEITAGIRNKISGGAGFMEQQFNYAGGQMMAHGGNKVVGAISGTANFAKRQALGFAGGAAAAGVNAWRYKRMAKAEAEKAQNDGRANHNVNLAAIEADYQSQVADEKSKLKYDTTNEGRKAKASLEMMRENVKNKDNLQRLVNNRYESERDKAISDGDAKDENDYLWKQIDDGVGTFNNIKGNTDEMKKQLFKLMKGQEQKRLYDAERAYKAEKRKYEDSDAIRDAKQKLKKLRVDRDNAIKEENAAFAKIYNEKYESSYKEKSDYNFAHMSRVARTRGTMAAFTEIFNSLEPIAKINAKEAGYNQRMALEARIAAMKASGKFDNSVIEKLRETLDPQTYMMLQMSQG